ncbi:MAG: hypothetical protein A3K12_13795 [Candidatus Rokubacteria bacterium RIFCSPLOWO2_12_FULL_71_19]|nr:MAG: hypothetical protein A3K12_13795 [Candidatus Rokubacteria bacterium RIFCSPLOWO2_12_FULL_71_19]
MALEREGTVQQLHGLNTLREQGRMIWSGEASGWVAAPEDIVDALSNDGFAECKRAMTTSRRDIRPAGGLWQGLNTRTGSVASAIWVNRPVWPEAIMFLTVDGESLTGPGPLILEGDPCREDGGEALPARDRVGG